MKEIFLDLTVSGKNGKAEHQMETKNPETQTSYFIFLWQTKYLPSAPNSQNLPENPGILTHPGNLGSKPENVEFSHRWPPARYAHPVTKRHYTTECNISLYHWCLKIICNQQAEVTKRKNGSIPPTMLCAHQLRSTCRYILNKYVK